MDPKEFIKKEVARGASQTEVARKVDVSNATVYKMLYTNTTLTLATIKKIAKAYDKPISFFISEEGPKWETPPAQLPAMEEKLLAAFRLLDSRRQLRALETLEDMALAGREFVERDGQAKDSVDLNLRQKSKG